MDLVAPPLLPVALITDQGGSSVSCIQDKGGPHGGYHCMDASDIAFKATEVAPSTVDTSEDKAKDKETPCLISLLLNCIQLVTVSVGLIQNATFGAGEE